MDDWNIDLHSFRIPASAFYIPIDFVIDGEFTHVYVTGENKLAQHESPTKYHSKSSMVDKAIREERGLMWSLP